MIKEYWRKPPNNQILNKKYSEVTVKKGQNILLNEQELFKILGKLSTYNNLTVSLWTSAMELEQCFCDQTPDMKLVGNLSYCSCQDATRPSFAKHEIFTGSP